MKYQLYAIHFSYFCQIWKVDFLEEIGKFVYYHKFNENLYEYEYDHVLAGKFDGEYELNLEEVSWLGWVDIDEVKKDVVENPDKYAVWFLTAFNIFLDWYEKK